MVRSDLVLGTLAGPGLTSWVESVAHVELAEYLGTLQLVPGLLGFCHVVPELELEQNPRTERFNILGKVRENENELTTEKIRKIQNYLCLEDTGGECS